MVNLPFLPKTSPIPVALVLILLLLGSTNTKAQYYNLGQDPASLRWRHIKTEHFDLVYPGDFEERAQNLMNLFTYVYDHGTKTLENKPARVPVIIHNRDIIPNAFSVWAPRRIELYTCPPQNTYSQDWMEQLAIHEYRHVVQMDMMNHGFTRFLTWILGEQATAAVTGLYIPMWFMEGDAVCTETALSHSGRGRIPSFEMEIRAQILQKGRFSYDKAVLGSYKDHVADQYILGYQLVANTRKNYGYKAWTQAFNEVACKPYMVTPLNHGLKKAIGMGKTALYRKTLAELDSLWKFQAKYINPSPVKLLTNPAPSGYIRYKYPHYVNDTLVIAERTSMDDISRFVLVGPHGQEKVLCTPGFFSSEVFSINIGTGFSAGAGNKPGSFTADNISLSKGLVAWTEREADPRWQNRSYSVLKLYDFSTGKIRSLTRHTRLFAPALSPDAASLVVVKVTENNVSSLVSINVQTGNEIKTWMTSYNDFYLNPSWSPDGSQLVYGILNEHGKSLWILDTRSGKIRQILPPTFTEISNPVFAGKYILYNGSYSGIENIYAIDVASLKVFQVTSALYGATNAELSKKSDKIVYSDYSSDGYRLAETGFNPAAWKPLEQVSDYSPSLYKYLVKEEQGIVDSTTLTHTKFESKPYHKVTHLFNFHSWAPAYVNFLNSETSTGISFMSQNAFSTATTIAGYEWDNAQKTGKYRLNFVYEGWYPILDVDASYGKRAASVKNNSDGSQFRFTWNEAIVSGGIKLPLVFNQGKNYLGLELSARTTCTKISGGNAPDTLKLIGFNTLDYRLYLYRYEKQANKDVYPRWGQVLDLNYRHSPFGGNDFGNIASARAVLYFPGLFPHQGFKLSAAFQNRNKGDFTYADLVAMPRGNLSVYSVNLLSFGANYKFPFLYPDASIGSLAYFKRVKANLFYDQAFTTGNSAANQYNSLGAEITSDMHLLRFLLPLDMGARIGYLPLKNKMFVDFLLSVNLAL